MAPKPVIIISYVRRLYSFVLLALIAVYAELGSAADATSSIPPNTDESHSSESLEKRVLDAAAIVISDGRTFNNGSVSAKALPVIQYNLELLNSSSTSDSTDLATIDATTVLAENYLQTTTVLNSSAPTIIGQIALKLTSPNITDNSSRMLVIEEKAMRLLPLEELPGMILLALGVTFMVIGGAIPYVFQYIEIHQRKSAVGFSLLVCLALCIANILRILFWFGEHFETPLLVQSIVMITCMILMLEISVRMNKKLVPPVQRTSVWRGDFLRAFWKWNDLSSFIFALVIFTIIASTINSFFYKNKVYVNALGMVALLVEACLGLPQLIRNLQRRSVSGMSVKMVLMWLIGDVGKTIYFIVKQTPSQFYICSCLQITIDILILLQVLLYGNRASGARIPTFSSTSTPKV